MLRRALLTAAFAFAIALPATLMAGDYADQIDDLADQKTRANAIRELADAGEEAYEDLIDGLGHENADARAHAARLLGRVGNADAIGALLDLVDGNPAENAPEEASGVAPAEESGEASTDNADNAGESEAEGAEGEPAESEPAPALPNTGDTDVAVRVAALQALAMLGDDTTRAQIGPRVLAFGEQENISNREVYASTATLVAIGYGPAGDFITGHLTPKGLPQLGLLAVEYLANKADSAAQSRLLSFLAQEREPVDESEDAPAEGESSDGDGTSDADGNDDNTGTMPLAEGSGAEPVEEEDTWAYDRRTWGAVRSAAVVALVRLENSSVVPFMLEELEQTPPPSKVVIELFARHAKAFGKALVDPALEMLLGLGDGNESGMLDVVEGEQRNNLCKILGQTGQTGLKALVNAVDQAIKDKEAEEAAGEGDETDEVDERATMMPGQMEGGPPMLVGQAFDQLIFTYNEHEEGRKAMLGLLRTRPAMKQNQPEGEEPKVDFVYSQLFRALLSLPTDQARTALESIGLTSSSGEIKREAIGRFFYLFNARQIEKLAPIADPAKTPDEETRLQLVRQIVPISVPYKLKTDMLQTLQSDPSEEVRAEVWQAYTTSKDKEALAELAKGLSDESELVRTAAGRALVQMVNAFDMADSDNKAFREELTTMMLDAIKEPAAAAGIVGSFYHINQKLNPQISSEDARTLREAARDAVDADNRELRIAAARAHNDIGNGDWYLRLMKQFLVEQDLEVATAQMDAIEQRVAKIQEKELDLVPAMIDQALVLMRQSVPGVLELRTLRDDASLTMQARVEASDEFAQSDSCYYRTQTMLKHMADLRPDLTVERIKATIENSMASLENDNEVDLNEVMLGGCFGALSNMNNSTARESARQAFMAIEAQEPRDQIRDYIQNALSEVDLRAVIEACADESSTRNTQLFVAAVEGLRQKGVVSSVTLSAVISAYQAQAVRGTPVIANDRAMSDLTDAVQGVVRNHANTSHVAALETLKEKLPTSVMSQNAIQSLISVAKSRNS